MFEAFSIEPKISKILNLFALSWLWKVALSVKVQHGGDKPVNKIAISSGTTSLSTR